MRIEFFLDLCFIREKVKNDQFVDVVSEQLKALFSDKGQWHTAVRQEGNLEIIVAEVNGIGSWNSEEEINEYLEKEAAPPFWGWLQGYQIRFDVKEHAECSHCGKE